MNIAMDVAYHPSCAVVGMVEFADWRTQRPDSKMSFITSAGRPYRPGQFYQRELPCLLAALAFCQKTYDHIVIDGYVHLKAPYVKGLGYHLFQKLGCGTRVVGIAKSPLSLAVNTVATYRGKSIRPLLVSAAGMDEYEASKLVQRMHGDHRIPTLVRLADRLSRAVTPTDGIGPDIPDSG